MSTVQMPTPPDGHYWRIERPGRFCGEYRRVDLVRPRKWLPDTVVQWGVFTPVTDEHANAVEVTKVAHWVLRKFDRGHGDTRAGLNGLTGYVDHKGVAR